MSIDEFARYSRVLHRLTVDFVRAVPDDKWTFTPEGNRFAPFCKQLRHVVCARGVYNAALATRRVDWTRKHEHYTGPLTREPLLAALDDVQRQLLGTLDTVDIHALIDWSGTPFTFATFTWEFEHLRLVSGVRHATQLAIIVGIVRATTMPPHPSA